MDWCQWECELTEDLHGRHAGLPPHDSGQRHSRRFAYEDRDEALTRFAGATAVGLDAKLDEVVRAPALPKPTLERPAGGRDPGCERARVAQACPRRISGG